MKYACAIPSGFTVAPYPERMHYSHANDTQISVTQIKQTSTITPVHCGASRQLRMSEKVYTTTKITTSYGGRCLLLITEQQYELWWTMPPTRLRPN